MKCPSCGGVKLSKEFLLEPIGDQEPTICTLCLRCIINDENLSPKLKERAKAKLNLCTIALPSPTSTNKTEHQQGTVFVSLLDGNKYKVNFESNMTVAQFKILTQNACNVQTTKQRLQYNGEELIDNQTLGNYGVVPGTVIHLIILLYQIKDVQNIQFNLKWGYPTMGRDYLDGSCLAFDNNNNFLCLVDYSHQIVANYYGGGNISHSGDLMDDTLRIGNHVIKINLDAIPNSIHYLFFTLSAWNSPTIANYPNPGFTFFDLKNPSVPLSEYNIQKAGTSQAVIVSVVYRKGNGWDVSGIGKLSDGNAKNYEPLKKSVLDVIAQNLLI